MTNAVPVKEEFLDLDDEERGEFDRFPVSSLWIELVSILLILIALVNLRTLLSTWLTSSDRLFFVFAMGLGLAFAFGRANWRGVENPWRLLRAAILWSFSIVCILCGMITSENWSHFWMSCAIGMAVAAWLSVRVRGELVYFGISIGMTLAMPALIDLIGQSGIYKWLESAAIEMTNSLADSSGISNIQEEGTIVFERGVARDFSSVGSIGGLISLLGISMFCGLARRRNLVSFLLSFLSCAFVWLAVRTFLWLILVHIGSRYGMWVDWSTMTDVIGLVLGAILVISVESFFGAILMPIPLEYLNMDFPLISLGWNWICGLPRLTFSVPQRESDFGPLEGEFEEEFV